MKFRERRRVLVIDDDPDIIELISTALDDDTIQLVTSVQMEGALVQFGGFSYDLVICDIFMDGMGGIAGIKEIRRLQPDAKIIAISGGYSEMSPRSALQAACKIGADAVLPKPFDLAVLEKMVTELLNG